MPNFRFQIAIVGNNFDNIFITNIYRSTSSRWKWNIFLITCRENKVALHRFSNRYSIDCAQPIRKRSQSIDLKTRLSLLKFLVYLRWHSEHGARKVIKLIFLVFSFSSFSMSEKCWMRENKLKILIYVENKEIKKVWILTACIDEVF